MRVLQVTNLVSHHQLPIAREFARSLGNNNFRFAALSPPDLERVRLGWSSAADDPWILRVGEHESDRAQFEQWWDEADIVLCGERRFDRMAERLMLGKPCFYTSERWWKPPLSYGRMLSPSFLNMAIHFMKIAAHQHFHYLPMGPFAARDISVLTNLNDRIWQWGYFTDAPSPKVVSVPVGKQLQVLWAGRMLDWKRVDTLIKAVAVLNGKGASVKLNLVGDGPERRALEQLASRSLDPDAYTFSEPVAAADVPDLMRKHHVYVLPSSGYEGWGAVINEAMACGRAVVASEKAGAAAAMIEDGVNGMLFKPGDWRSLVAHLSRLAGDAGLKETLAHAAQLTASRLWSPVVAAERLLTFGAALINKRQAPEYSSGPMASAKHWTKWRK